MSKQQTQKTVSLVEIAASLKMSPKNARRIMRKAKAKKPAAGWVFPANKRAEIAKLLQS